MNQSGASGTVATPRTATISRDDTRSIGVCIFLTAAELRELGVDPAQSDAIEYRLVQTNGEPTLSITESSGSPGTTVRDSIAD